MVFPVGRRVPQTATSISKGPLRIFQKGPGVKPAAQALHKPCSVHNKMRGLSSLETDGRGGFVCSSGMECKLSSLIPTELKAPKGTVPECGTALCIVHNKNRALSCLEEDGMGGYQCSAEFECKGTAMVSEQQPFDNTQALCAVHHKKRAVSNMRRTKIGYSCVRGAECKTASGPAQQFRHHNSRASPKSAETDLCMTHQKFRAVGCLIQQRDGNYTCSPQFECKEKTVDSTDGPSHAVCSVHNKLRAVQVMEEDGTGGMSCTSGNECKMARQ